MFSFFQKKPRSITITASDTDNKHITTQPGETILQGGIREGVRLPHNCRVGGCAECKCKLISGKVKELTESAYVLSEQELDEGYILACQSVPKTDIEIQVARLENDGPHHDIKKAVGEITAHQSLTHDIVKIDITLPESIPFTSGQYAELSIPGTIDQARSYSFSHAYQKNTATVSFFVRAVPNGKMSNYLQDGSIIGSDVLLAGPHGDFWLRESDQPILAVAGGSGLAPILALLEQALQNNIQRPVTFIFGARTQQDLYALDSINDIAQQWPVAFTFISILSDEPEGSNWVGPRGLVTDIVDNTVSGNEHAYMCGPPAMIDAMSAALQKKGVQANNIYFDKFLDSSHTQS